MKLIIAIPIIIIMLFFARGIINKLIDDGEEKDKNTAITCWAIAIGFALLIGFLFAIASPIAKKAPAVALITVLLVITIMAALIVAMHNFDTSVLVNMVWIQVMVGVLLMTHTQALTVLVHSNFWKSVILCFPVWTTVIAVAIMLLDAAYFWYKNELKPKAIITASATAIGALLVFIVSLFAIHFP